MPLPQNNLAIPAPAYPPLQHYVCDAKFSWASECRHLFSSRSLNIFWWPVFEFRQRRFNHSPLFQSCRALPGFSNLWKTIQKGSFAYNNLFLGITPLQRSSGTDLADITTLALFFSDEFIDGIAAAAGKPFIRKLIHDNPGMFYLKKKIKDNKVMLEYRFDLKCLLTPDVWQQVNPKYNITYDRFYILLQSFLQMINKELDKLLFPKAEKTACKIADACNTCFDSFLHDVNSCPEPGNITEPDFVLHFHEMKTAYMQTKLLELRCILVNKEQAMTSIQTPGWLDIMRVIQIYDDIHDAIIDDGIQDNLLLSVAYHYFPAEWEWFAAKKHETEQLKQKSLLLSLYMPCSMEYCLQLAGNKIRTMNWEQQKIMHYLLFKNKHSLYTETADKVFTQQNNFLLQFYRRIKHRMPHLSVQSIKSFAIDTCVHLPGLRKQLLGKIDLSTAYQLRYNLLSVPSEMKAAIFDAVTAK
jgi:hypothetical protein